MKRTLTIACATLFVGSIGYFLLRHDAGPQLLQSSATSAAPRSIESPTVGTRSIGTDSSRVSEAQTITAHKIVPLESPRMEENHSNPPGGNSASQQQASTQRSFQVLMESLAKGREALAQVPAYYAVLEKQVFLDGRLLNEEVLDIKVRHKPFSVYLKWRSDQQEVLYVDGRHDGRLVVRPTRGLVALRKIWRLPPDSPQAMKKNRHPVTSLGVERLHAMVDGFHEGRGYSSDGLQCRHYEETIHGERCLRIETTFPNPREGGEFSRSIVTFCPKRELVIGVENYGWTDDGRPGPLLERYFYRDLSVKPTLSDEEFDMENPNYNFI